MFQIGRRNWSAKNHSHYSLYMIGVGRLNISKMKPAFGFPPIFARRIRISWSFSPQTLVNDSSRIFYFKCDKCDKRFGLSWNLSKHQKTHSKEKAFKCGECPSMFTKL